MLMCFQFNVKLFNREALDIQTKGLYSYNTDLESWIAQVQKVVDLEFVGFNW